MPSTSWATVGMPDGVKVNLVRLPDAPKTRVKRQMITPRGSMSCRRMRGIVLAGENSN